MSYINIAKAIAPIAKNIGDDVVRGMSKADDVAKTADDWGWKGGKPGEVTGDEFIEDYGSPYIYHAPQNIQKKANEQLDKASKQFSKAVGKGKPIGEIWSSLKRSFPNLSSLQSERYATKIVLANFAKLEKADFPREWTGKTFPLTQRYDVEGLQQASDVMKNLSNKDRQKFIDIAENRNYKLYPDQIGDILNSKYADNIIKNLPKLQNPSYLKIEEIEKIFKSPYADDILNMLPQWDGSIDDLIKAVELL